MFIKSYINKDADHEWADDEKFTRNIVARVELKVLLYIHIFKGSYINAMSK